MPPPDLGPIVAIYPAWSMRWRRRLGLLLALVLLVLLPGCYGLYLYYYGYTHYGPAAASIWSRSWLAAACLLFLAWLWFLLGSLHLSRRSVILHQNGLQLKGFGWLSSPRTFLWDQIAGIATENVASRPWLSPTQVVLTTVRLTLIGQNGSRSSLSESCDGSRGIQNLPELITRLKASLYPRLYPPLLARWFGGEWLEFGPVSVQFNALFMRLPLGNQTVPWTQIQRITVQSGYLVVELVQSSRPSSSPSIRTYRFSISRIPNLELLLQLINQGSR